MIFGYKNANTAPMYGIVAPTTIVPSFIGQIYIDTEKDVAYISYGLAAGNWLPQSVGLLDYMGAYDASTNTYPTSGSGISGEVLQGDLWVVSVQGTLGGEIVHVGDMIIANIDNPEQTASNWDHIQGNLSYVPEDEANKVSSFQATTDDNHYPSEKLVKDNLDLKATADNPNLTGNVTLENTTSSTTGVIFKGTDRFIHNFQHPTGSTAVPAGYNTFVGINSGNFIMGSTATEIFHGSYNTGLGYGALFSNTTGYNNAGIGYYSGRYITDGTTANQTSNNSVYLGYDTRALANGDTNEIVIGASAIGAGSNTVTLGNSSIITTILRGDVTIPETAATTDTDKFAVLDSGVIKYRTGVELLSDIGGQSSLGYTPEDVSNKSTNISTDGSSDTKYPSVKAIKDYADGLVAGLLDYRGGYDASGNTYPVAGGSGTSGEVLKGDIWIISVAGTLGGEAVQVGDSIIANVDTPAQTASNWNHLNANISYVPEDVANRLTSFQGTPDDNHYPSEKLVKDSLDAKAPLISPSFTTPTLGAATGTSLDLEGTTLGMLSLKNTDANSYTRMLFDGTGTDFSVGVGNASASITDLQNKFYIYDFTNSKIAFTVTPNTLEAKFFGEVGMMNNTWLKFLNYAGTNHLNALKGTTSDELELGTPLNSGTIEAETDAGAITIFDMPVSDAPTAGDEMSATFKIDANNVFKIGAKADGAGAVDSQFIQSYGAIFRHITTVNAATYDLLASDDILNVTYTATGAVTITIPTAQCVAGRTIVIKDAGGNAGTNNITIDTEGETIDGAATKVISSNYDSTTLYSDGSNWFII